MLQRKMFYVYCSKKDAVSIRDAIRNMPNVQLIITASHGSCSIKNIIQKLKKANKLRPSDYVFGIDDCDTVNFINNYKLNRVLHFRTVSLFFMWFDKEFAVENIKSKNERGGFIECNKKH